MEGTILKCPKGYIKKMNGRYNLVPTKEDATMFFVESFVDDLMDYLAPLLNINISSFEKLKAKRVTTIIN